MCVCACPFYSRRNEFHIGVAIKAKRMKILTLVDHETHMEVVSMCVCVGLVEGEVYSDSPS